MTTATIIFGVCLGAYFLGLGVFSLVKFLLARKKVKKEVENEQSQN